MKIKLLASIFLLFSHQALSYVPDEKETCQISAAAKCSVNHVEFTVDGPCPSYAKTISPYKSKNCTTDSHDQSEQNVIKKIPSSADPVLANPTPKKDSRWMPFIILSIVLVLLAAFLLKKKYKQPDFWYSLLKSALIFAISLFVGFLAARFVFYKSFELIKNKDSLAGALIAFPMALVTVIVISALITFLINLLLKKIDTRKN